jgi:hypothetical protein
MPIPPGETWESFYGKRIRDGIIYLGQQVNGLASWIQQEPYAMTPSEGKLEGILRAEIDVLGGLNGVVGILLDAVREIAGACSDAAIFDAVARELARRW